MEDDTDIEVPHFFTCPISLQIMKDPVTAVTGITYDRDGIEQWLFCTGNATCPVTKQPLPPGSDLIPNHTLRRLIQAWCTANSARGVARIPTPKPPLSQAHLAALLKDLSRREFGRLKVIKHLELLAAENDRNRRYMAECGASAVVFSFVAESCFRRDSTEGLEEALSLLRLIRSNDHSAEIDPISEDNELIMDCFTWILSSDTVETHVKTLAALLLQSVVVEASARNPSPAAALSRLKPEFLDARGALLRRSGGADAAAAAARTAALRVMFEACPHARNRVALVESGAVFELVELDMELGEQPQRRTAELVMGVLFHLCWCADGRARLVSHRGAVAAVARRILRVSEVVDERAVMILSLVCRFSGTKQVVREMMEVGAVSKLCVLMQSECSVYLKDKVREMLKAHSGEWKDSPCIAEYHYPN